MLCGPNYPCNSPNVQQVSKIDKKICGADEANVISIKLIKVALKTGFLTAIFG